MARAPYRFEVQVPGNLESANCCSDVQLADKWMASPRRARRRVLVFPSARHRSPPGLLEEGQLGRLLRGTSSTAGCGVLAR